MESIAELRRRVQRPVRRYNDVAGLLVGDRVSIHVTRLFLKLGLSPTVATASMLICGLVGSALAILGGGFAVVGFALAFLYYVFDCVDGEVARYRGQQKFSFAFVDFVTHLLVKPAFFTAVGIWAVRVSGEPAVFLFALAALVATLLQKLLQDAAVILAGRQVLMRGREERYRYVAELLAGHEDDLLARDLVLRGDEEPYRPSPLQLVRVAAANFDLGLLAFLLAAVLDLWLQPFDIVGVRMDLKALLVVYYGLVVPYDLADRFVAYVRADGFMAGARTLVRRAHHFRCDEDPPAE